MFKEYQAKPIIRMARTIKDDDKIEYDKAERSAKVTRKDGQEFIFNAHQEPVVGDYIIHRGDSAPVLQPKAQFEDNHIIE